MKLRRIRKAGACALVAGLISAAPAVADEFVCGDGRVDPPIETCDPPGQRVGQDDACRQDCTFCGDGFVQPLYEACDDGNNRPGDGCENDCHLAIFVDVTGDDENGIGTKRRPYATIQKALDVADDFSKIIVRAGTYHECLRAGYPDILDRPVKIVALEWLTRQDNAATTIDGSGICDRTRAAVDRAPVVRLGSRASGLEGFTITGGGDSGVRARGSAVITNNVITENFSTMGGGIYFYSGVLYFSGDVEAEISNNVISLNRSEYAVPAGEAEDDREGGDGGGLFVKAIGREGNLPTSGEARVTIANNTIIGNTIHEDSVSDSVHVHGGGLGVFTSSTPLGHAEVVITNNMISGNGVEPGASGYGGGAWLYTYGYGTETITARDNVIENNHANLDGGGISAWITTYGTRGDEDPDSPDSNTQHTLTLEDNTIRDNEALANGGGLDLYLIARNLKGPERVRLEALDNLVTGNHAGGNQGGGGGILATSVSWKSQTPGTGLLLQGNTVTDNTTELSGGGLALLVLADSNPPSDTTGRPPARAVTGIVARRNLVANNEVLGAGGVGGGVFTYLRSFADSSASVTVDMQTVTGNRSSDGTGGIHFEAFTGFDDPPGSTAVTRLELWNSIVTENTGWGVGGAEPAVAAGVLAPNAGTGNLILDVEYSDVWGNPLGPYDSWLEDPTGTHGNMSVDPMLGDGWIPEACSPTIDGGDPDLEFGGESAPNGGRANMGHTSGTSIATQSLPDLSGDGIVDGIDVLDISVAFGSAAGDPRYDVSGDFDGNGVVDGLDLAFVADAFLEVCE